MAPRSSLTRRRVLGVAGLATAVAGTGGCAAAPTPPHRRNRSFRDDFRRGDDGPLPDRVSLSGHRWSARSAAPAALPVVSGAALGPPAGYVPGGSDGTSPGYAVLEDFGPLRRIGARWRWDRSSSVASALTIGALSWVPGRLDANRGSNVHLVINPVGLVFAVCTDITVDFTPIPPDGRVSPDVAFPRRQVCDGATIYQVDVAVDRAAATALVSVDGLPTLVYRHPTIGAVAAQNPIWEYWTKPGGTNLPRVTEAWAEAE